MILSYRFPRGNLRPASARRTASAPRVVARNAIARRPTTPSGQIKYTVTLYLTRETAEALTARALREGKNSAFLIGEVLGAEMRRTLLDRAP